MPDITHMVNKEFRNSLTKCDSLELHKQFCEELNVAQETSDSIWVKPYFIDEFRHQYIRHATEIFSRILQKVTELYYTHPEIRNLFTLTELEEELMAIEPGYSNYIQMIQYDVFVGEDYLQFFRVDTDSPTQPIKADLHGEVFEKSQIFQKLQQKFCMSRDPIMPHFLRTLLVAYHDFGCNNTPLIAIVTKEDKNSLIYESLIKWFQSLEYKAILCHPEELTYNGDNLVTKDEIVIDVIYRGDKLSEWTSAVDKVKHIIDAIKNRSVCMLNSFCSALTSNKSFLAVLKEESLKTYFDSEELKIITETVPWTKIVKEGATEGPGGQEIDLLAFIREHREQLVLKPCQLGNQDVFIGRDITEESWNNHVEEAAKSKFIVQSYIHPTKEELPIFNPELNFISESLGVSLYSYGGLYSGGVVWKADSDRAIEASLFCVTDEKEDIATVRISRDSM